MFNDYTQETDLDQYGDPCLVQKNGVDKDRASDVIADYLAMSDIEVDDNVVYKMLDNFNDKNIKQFAVAILADIISNYVKDTTMCGDADDMKSEVHQIMCALTDDQYENDDIKKYEFPKSYEFPKLNFLNLNLLDPREVNNEVN